MTYWLIYLFMYWLIDCLIYLLNDYLFIYHLFIHLKEDTNYLLIYLFIFIFIFLIFFSDVDFNDSIYSNFIKFTINSHIEQSINQYKQFIYLFIIIFHFRKMVSRIDQSEFEGFEYVNPLLMSGEEVV